MDDQIRELAQQAGEYVNSVYTPPVRSKTPGKIWEDGHIGWMEQFHAKFAELIIQECIEQIQLSTARDPYDSPQYIQSVGHIRKIKEHFGVSE